MFLIYFFLITEGCLTKSTVNSPNIIRGYTYYKFSGIFNIIISLLGVFLLDFLRSNDILPVWSIRVGNIGFMLIWFVGIYHIFKAVTTSRA